MESSLFFLVAVIAGGLFLLWMILYFIPIGLWFQALVSDVKISLLQLGFDALAESASHGYRSCHDRGEKSRLGALS